MSTSSSLQQPLSKKRKLCQISDSSNEHKSIDANILVELKNTCQLSYDEYVHSSLSSKDIWIDENAIDNEIKANSKQYEHSTDNKYIWSKEDFHYFNIENIELSLRFILVLDSLNFCFWPLKDYQYRHLAKGLKCTLEQNNHAFDAQNLKTVNEHQLQQWLLQDFNTKTRESEIKIPLISERVRLLNEVGNVLLSKYDGQVSNLISSANSSACELVRIMSHEFRGFADHCICPWNGKQIPFYKRAQIFVADIYAAFSTAVLPKNSTQQSSISDFLFLDISQLTTFADYRVPQLLRQLNIIRFSPRLQHMIDDQQMICAGSKEEILIRMCTVSAMEKFKQRLKEIADIQLMSIELDWNVWNRGEKLEEEGKLSPHHRTLTIYY